MIRGRDVVKYGVNVKIVDTQVFREVVQFCLHEIALQWLRWLSLISGWRLREKCLALCR